MYTTLLALMFACGDAEETQDIPTPPAKEVKEAPKAAPKAEAPKEEPKEAAVADESGKDGAAPAEAGTVGGTNPEVKTSEKLMTTGEVKAPHPNCFRQSGTNAQRKAKEGYQTAQTNGSKRMSSRWYLHRNWSRYRSEDNCYLC